jgi:hypothetical protein
VAEQTKHAEHARLEAAREGKAPWKKWGPYLSERQWGTVREDYSDDGNAWAYFTHDQSRSRAYRWGEDGLGGVSDEKQRLCFALAMWNGKDPILKERLFGLANAEGNHGEDVKEYYFYLDSTPTHSYMKWLYKYPQRAYPYDDLVATNHARSAKEMEYELLDTGVFEGDRYFDVQAEYAKASPEDLFVRITVTNRGPEKAALQLLPTLWFRNTWSWGAGGAKPKLAADKSVRKGVAVAATHETLGARWFYCEGAPALLFTENETDTERIFGKPNAQPYVKDAFHSLVVQGKADAVNPKATGTKSAAHYTLDVAPGASVVVRLRLTDAAPAGLPDPFADCDDTFAARQREADDFYRVIIPPTASADAALVARQAHAGMFWTKQYYLFDVRTWLDEHGADPFKARSKGVRNKDWYHMVNDDVISMPDKWEYPWYAAWDLAFHAIALSGADVDLAKEQLEMMLRATYQHPNGQLPAYEWNFGDVNPPVHAWGVLWQYRIEQSQRGKGDIDFLKRAFAKLMLNFTWWVNRKDSDGNNLFSGGFLGLDNIGVFDRSAPLPNGGTLEQADGTAWMAMFCQNMLEIAFELAAHDPTYEDLALKFAEHFLWIGSAMNKTGDDALWDEEDGFYYDVLVLPDGTASRMKVRSMVGLLPLCATTVIEAGAADRVPRVAAALAERLRRNPELRDSIHPFGPGHAGEKGRMLAALVNPERLRRILSRMLDEKEFLGPYGLRSLSRYHADHPFVIGAGGSEYRVSYLPAESDSTMFGGNSNWRGPVWFPVNALLIRALTQFYFYYGDNFKVECPTGSGQMKNLFEVAKELTSRLERIFLRGPDGRRPVFGGSAKFQEDPHWKDHILFYEYFHGDLGAGIGASHQTGWTGLFSIFQHYGTLSSKKLLAGGKEAAFET